MRKPSSGRYYNLIVVSAITALLAVLLTGLVLRRQSNIGVNTGYSSVNSSFGYPSAYLFRQERDLAGRKEVREQVDVVIFLHNLLAWFAFMLAVNTSFMLARGLHESSRY